MSATDPPLAGEPSDPGAPPEERSAKRSPWLWATIGLAVVAVALGLWGLHERSNAGDAKADLQAEQEQTAPPGTTTDATTQAQQQTSTQSSTPASTTQTTESNREGVGVAALAAAGTAFAAARKALNEGQEQVDDLETDVDKANAEAEQAQQDAKKAEEEAASAAKSAEKQKAEDEQADAQKRQLRAKADAAAACAKAMLEIVGEIPSAASIDEGLKNAAGEVKALVPKCKDALAAAGN